MTRLRYWHWERRVGRAFLQLNPSDLPIPRVHWEWMDEPGAGYLSLELCSAHADPVIGVDLDLTLPGWLARPLNWWGSCRECGCWLGLVRSGTHASSCSRYHLRWPR